MTAIKELTPSVMSDAGSVGQCYYGWARKPLPDESVELQNALFAADVQFISAIAEAYGEDCIDSATNKAVSFSAIGTDFRISLAVNDLTAKENMGNLAYQIIKMILGFPSGAFPGPNPSCIGIIFHADSNDLNLLFQISAIKLCSKRNKKD